MNKVFCSMVVSFTFLFSFGQDKVASDTIHSSISVLYHNVKYSDGMACFAELKVSFFAKSNRLLLSFMVPNYDARYRTTAADYAIIKVKDSEVKLQNTSEFDANGLIHKFVFETTKEKLLALLPDNLETITFYFMPDHIFVVKSLANEQGLDKNIKEYYTELSKQTVETKISKPDKKQYSNMVAWLQNL